jgi:hypothetical protein
MSLANYGDLKSAVTTWLNRDDLDSQVPDFIALAETRLKKRFKGVTTLSDVAPTSAFLTSYPDVYLYASLVEAEPFLQNDQRLQTWLSLYDRASAEIRIVDTAATLTTYAGLKATVASWLDRADIDDAIPSFVELAENRIFHELRAPVNEKTILLTLSSDGYATLPSDFLEVVDVFWNYNPLSRVTLTQLHSYLERTGVAPEVFARETYRFRFFPLPTVEESDELRMIYYYDPGRLTDSSTSNVVFAAAPELYLYATLAEASNYLGMDGSQYEASYQTAFGRLMQHAVVAENAGATATVQMGY